MTGSERHPRPAVPRWVVAGFAGLLLSGCGGAPSPPPAPRVPQLPSASVPAPAATSGAGAEPTRRPPPSAVPSPAPTRGASPRPGPTPPPGPVIVIDPGHSGRSTTSTDAATGLRDIDYPNYPEIYEVYDVSWCTAAALRSDGYRVRLTKTSALASVGLAARARLADRAGAALALSVHDDHSQGPDFQATYSQRGVEHGGRHHAMYRGTGRTRTVFARPAVARASAAAADAIAAARTTAQQRPVTVRENTFTGRAPLEPGNLALVQLLAHVPWVYNEAGVRTNGRTDTAMSIATETAYARGLVLGVESAVPLPTGTRRPPHPGVDGLRRCLVDRVEPQPGRPTRPVRYLPDGYR